jgi:hypothetical protein
MAFGRRSNNSEAAAQIARRLQEHQAELEKARGNVAALEEERARAVDARDEAATDAADRKLMLAEREAEALARGVERLGEQLAETSKREALEDKRRYVEYVRKLAAEGVKKAERRVALSDELRAITTELAAITALVREANATASEMGLERISYPTAGVNGILLSRTVEDDLAVAKRAKELRAAAA